MRIGKPWRLLVASLAVVAAFFLLREHWAHAAGLTSYPLLLLCPLLHLFHGHASHRPSKAPEKEAP